mgnify:CR=1 FL=1
MWTWVTCTCRDVQICTVCESFIKTIQERIKEYDNNTNPVQNVFFGGGTDFPEFYKEHGGAVISTTFDKYCYVNVRHLPRFFHYSTELSYSKIERVTSVEDIEHPAIREAMKMLDMHELRLTYEADLPARSGWEPAAPLPLVC